MNNHFRIGDTVKIIGHTNDESYYHVGALLYHYGEIIELYENCDFVKLKMETGEEIRLNIRCIEKMDFPMIDDKHKIAFIMYPEEGKKNETGVAISMSICYRLFKVNNTSQLDLIVTKIKNEYLKGSKLLFKVTLLDSEKSEDLFYYENGFKPTDDQLISFLSEKIKEEQKGVEDKIRNRGFY